MTGVLDGEAAVLVLLAALALDTAFGEMALLLRNAVHPVVAIGRVVGWLDRRLNKPQRGDRARFWRGVFTMSAVILLAGGFGWLVAALAAGFPGGWLIEALLVAILLSQRSLYEHVAAVARALRQDGLAGGRAAIRHIVSRDPDSMDEPGIARAALESLSENFADGIVAPVFWYAIAGLPGICAYKAINTADSMIGYRTNKYAAFGKAAARLDDAVNWIPARLAALVTVIAAALTGNDPARAIRIMRRDAHTHASPNAGWPEAAFAGALGLAFGGPRVYQGQGKKEHWIGGDGKRKYGPKGIARGLMLYVVACAVNGLMGIGFAMLRANLV